MSKKKQKKLTIYTLGLGFLLPLCVLTLYVFVKNQPDTQPTELAANSKLAIDKTAGKTSKTDTQAKEVTAETLFPDTKPIRIKDFTVKASIADSWPERILGLSNTPFLPEDTVKFFAFDSDGYHSIWMKDMNYAIDIIWTDENGSIVYIVSDATPESYPDTFTPDQPARFVIETVSGFVKKQQIAVGDKVEIPDLGY